MGMTMKESLSRVRIKQLLLIWICQALVVNCYPWTEGEGNEIGGLVIDRTITRFGRQFYEDFCARWREVKKMQDTNVVVVEVPIPQSGTRLSVEIDHTKVFQAHFGRRADADTQSLASSAVFRSAEFIATRIGVESSPDLHGTGY